MRIEKIPPARETFSAFPVVSKLVTLYTGSRWTTSEGSSPRRHRNCLGPNRSRVASGSNPEHQCDWWLSLIIDPDGLFDGDRFDLVSDEAHLYWPFFWCASNTLGRIELSYRALLRRAFGRFKAPPDERTFWRLVTEYRDSYLLFTYESNGSIWGQWFTSEKWLPSYKLAADLRSPVPEPIALEAWKDRYYDLKRQLNANRIALNDSKTFQNLSKDSEDFQTSPYGIGIGIGKGTGIGKTPSSPLSGAVCVDGPLKGVVWADAQQAEYLRAIGWKGWKKATDDQLDHIANIRPDGLAEEAGLGTLYWLNARENWFREFYESYWRKVGKKPARLAFMEACPDLDTFDRIRAAVESQTPEMSQRPVDKIPYPATWLNQARFNDQKSGKGDLFA